ncbi:hypothetical protein [Actinophytocola sp.]|uniref:hypothetical protein n=1 Tax=Actinophytocola sp. TaxID=1872138 RepID=UPI002ED2169A
MSQPTRLEAEIAEARFLAAKAEKEVSDMQAVFRGHTGTINAIRADQVDHGKKLARVEAEMRTGFAEVKSEMRNGFANVDNRFAKVDKQFAKVDEQFAKVDEQFAKVDEQFAKVNERFTKVDEQFAKVDKRFTKVDEQFAKVDKHFDKVDKRFDKLEGEMRDGFSEVEKKFELLHRGQEQITELLTRHLGEPDEETRSGGADE